MQDRSGKVAFGAMMAALTVLFLIVYQFVPVFGFFARFLVPIPIILTVLRHDLPVGLLVAIAASLIVGFVGGPMTVLGMFMLFAPLALVAGATLKAQWQPWRTFLASTAGQVIGIVIFYALTFYVTGVDVGDIAQYAAQLEKEIWDFYTASGALEQMQNSGLNTTMIKKNIATGVKWTILLSPGILVVAAAIVTQVVLVFSRIMATRLQLTVQYPKPFTQWIAPAYMAIPVLAAWGVLLLGRQVTLPEWLLVVMLNLMIPALLAIGVSGASFFFSQLRLNQSGPLFRFIVIALLIVFFQGFILVSIVVGLFDVLLDFRKLRTGKDRVA